MLIPFFRFFKPETSESSLTQDGTPIAQVTHNRTLKRTAESHLRIYKQLVMMDGRRRSVKESNKILTFCYSPRLLESVVLVFYEAARGLTYPVKCEYKRSYFERGMYGRNRII